MWLDALSAAIQSSIVLPLLYKRTTQSTPGQAIFKRLMDCPKTIQCSLILCRYISRKHLGVLKSCFWWHYLTSCVPSIWYWVLLTDAFTQVECPAGYLKWLLNVVPLCLEKSFCLQLLVVTELEMLHFSKKTIKWTQFFCVRKSHAGHLCLIWKCSFSWGLGTVARQSGRVIMGEGLQGSDGF